MSGLFQLLGTGARSLMAAQLAQATVGNNAANAATPGFSRRRVSLTEAPTVRLTGGIFGTGVQAADVARVRDALVDARRRLDGQELTYAQAQKTVLGGVEALFGPADANALGTTLNALFAAFGSLAAAPEDSAVRQSLVAAAQNFTGAVHGVHDALLRQEADATAMIRDRVTEVNATATRLAELNTQAVAGAADPALQDEQDRLVDRLSDLIGVRATRRADGSVQVTLDGTGILLVDGARTASVSVSGTPSGGTVDLTISGGTVSQTRGEIGGLMHVRNSATDGVPAVVAALDAFARDLVAAVNRVHASGAGRTLANSVTGTVEDTVPAVPLASAGLWHTPVSGTLRLGVFNAAGTMVSTASVLIDPATMSLNDLATTLDALPDISASVASGHLVISATNAANRIAFGPDTSDTLVALGINGFFSGTDAGSLAVSADVAADPSRVAAAQGDFTAGVISAGDNRNARALAALALSAVMNGNTQTPGEFLGGIGTSVGDAARSAAAHADMRQALVDAADAQRQAVSGVNLDEEMADMVRYQHAYEASARYIQTINDMIDSLMEIVR